MNKDGGTYALITEEIRPFSHCDAEIATHDTVFRQEMTQTHPSLTAVE
jgi:hypothetical protein